MKQENLKTDTSPQLPGRNISANIGRAVGMMLSWTVFGAILGALFFALVVGLGVGDPLEGAKLGAFCGAMAGTILRVIAWLWLSGIDGLGHGLEWLVQKSEFCYHVIVGAYEGGVKKARFSAIALGLGFMLYGAFEDGLFGAVLGLLVGGVCGFLHGALKGPISGGVRGAVLYLKHRLRRKPKPESLGDHRNTRSE